MRVSVISVVVVVLLGSTHGAAWAQDSGRVGLTMAYPSAVGVFWQVTDRLALRPDVSFGGSSVESTVDTTFGSFDLSSSQWSVTAGLSALIYLQRWESVRTYISPRIARAWDRRTTSEAIVLGGPDIFPGLPETSRTRSETVPTFIAGTSFGVQYVPARHFGVFGEVGFNYERQSRSFSSSVEVTPSSRQYRLGSGIGVILLFP